MLDVLIDTLLDGVKLLPFLFITYLLMELLEHKAGKKTEDFIRRSGKLGPFFGGLLGIIPQCGFSAAASGFYAGRVITIGTLAAVFLSTSDEMLMIMIPECIHGNISPALLFSTVGIKFVYAVLAGFVIDFIFRKKREQNCISELCRHDKCHCERGIFVSSLLHTLEVFAYILVICLVLNTAIYFIGEDTLKALISDKPVLGELVAGLIGLIPNCAASVIITELYLSGLISYGALLSGLFVGAGIGIAILFKANKHVGENLMIVGILYAAGVIGGLLVSLVSYLL